MTGVDKKAMGKAEATSCQVMEATIVVIRAPRSPVSKKAWRPSETPKMFSVKVVYMVEMALST